MADPDHTGHRGSMSEDNDPEFSNVDGICHTCVHRTSLFNCRAFPQGIPREILRGDFLHVTPYAGDRGFQYERGFI